MVLAAKARRRLKHLLVVYQSGSPDMLRDRHVRLWERGFIKSFNVRRLTLLRDQHCRARRRPTLPG